MENTGTDLDDNGESHPWPREGPAPGDENMTGDLYTDDDIWEIRVLGNLVQYLRNDIVVYTSEKRVPFDSWPLHIIVSAPYNNTVQTGTDHPEYQGFRNIKFINYSEGFYLTNENYFQDIKTSTTNSGVNKIEDNSTIVSWRNINDNHSIKNEDTNALKIFSNSIGFRTIDENAAKNMYRANFYENLSITKSENKAIFGIWFQFELSSNCKCVPAFIKMSYYNINNVPFELFLFASNDDSVSSDIENSPKWINIKSFSLDLHNHSMVDTINKTLTFEMNHTLSYRYFRLVITKINNSEILSFYNLQLNGNVIEIN
jgi:Zn/Cd-binding protein ZinT